MIVEQLQQKYNESRVKKFSHKNEADTTEEKIIEATDVDDKSKQSSEAKSDEADEGEKINQTVSSTVVVMKDGSGSNYFQKSGERGSSVEVSSDDSRGRLEERLGGERTKERSRRHKSPHVRSKSSRKVDYYDSHSRKSSSKKSPYDCHKYSKKSSREHDKYRGRSQKSHYRDYEDYKEYRKRK